MRAGQPSSYPTADASRFGAFGPPCHRMGSGGPPGVTASSRTGRRYGGRRAREHVSDAPRLQAGDRTRYGRGKRRGKYARGGAALAGRPDHRRSMRAGRGPGRFGKSAGERFVAGLPWWCRTHGANRISRVSAGVIDRRPGISVRSPHLASWWCHVLCSPQFTSRSGVDSAAADSLLAVVSASAASAG
jgi:hypothetical protein